MAVRVRFAPSPTGALHLGGLRTALFNYLFARQHGDNGRFVLRIEDTDQTRLVQGSQQRLVAALRWAGLNYDEGPDVGGPYGPYVQSQRLPLYARHAEELIDRGHAYRCFCDVDRLEQLRKTAAAKKRPYMYDRRCQGLTKADVDARLRDKQPYTVRLKVPEGGTSVMDMVYKRVDFQNAGVDDQVLLKSDGFPTYHLANVVDDHHMHISHVIRGEEWLSSTVKHIMLYKAFEWTLPKFAHLPLLLNDDRSKLSKRNNDVDVGNYQRDYMPEALVNFVAFLGWAPRTPKELFSLPELVSEFELDRVHKGGAVVVRAKLNWFNRRHIMLKAATPEGLTELLQTLRTLFAEQQASDWLAPADTTSEHKWRWQDPAYLTAVLQSVMDRTTLLRDLPTLFSYFFRRPTWQGEAAAALLAKLAPASINPFATNLLTETAKSILMKPSGELIWKAPLPAATESEHSATLAAQPTDSVPSAPSSTASSSSSSSDETAAHYETRESRQLGEAIAKAGEPLQLSYKQAMLTARYVLSGTSVGPAVGVIMAVLGPQETLDRLQLFLARSKAT